MVVHLMKEKYVVTTEFTKPKLIINSSSTVQESWWTSSFNTLQVNPEQPSYIHFC